ncbi:type VII secretion protein EccB [Streptomyces spiroverticillatus]|uniref:Type VII secretion protein EccB n=1 Tax=Streptomyces finlayi TaxID=67296 RepID=A0A919CCF9_9ACTN|nr:type VII secretion protein EccB [Streptomyces finlayi]GHA25859.1 type VII secretion protein EccB [Streptomyces spiroverticillatus]GHD05155.1 type VII secretion protein EccB [Streptomyces finlayi]
MASRRDELNAYVFAKRRLVAQFLHPTSTGSEEGAPRPLRAVLPGVLAGVVGLAGFGVWGLLRPAAPPEWNKAYANVIVANPSTTRYVVLRTNGKEQLHPVLNMASARLLVNPGRNGETSVIRVADSIIDDPRILRGPTVGIPYAPDRLPSPREAGTAKPWIVCDRPQNQGKDVQTAVFVLSGKDEADFGKRQLLRNDALLYVRSTAKGGKHHLVDASGTSYVIRPEDDLLVRLLAGDEAPRPVSEEWLRTLHHGTPLSMPEVPGASGVSKAPGLSPPYNRVGTLLEGREGDGVQRYVVLRDRVAPVTDFVAKLLRGSGKLPPPPPGRDYHRVDGLMPGADFAPPGSDRWPTVDSAVRSSSGATTCSVLHSVNPSTGRTTLGIWSGPDFPHALPGATTPAYVTPGSGQLFRQFTGTRTDIGPVFLATDAGFRHSLQTKGIAEPGDSGYRDGPDPAADMRAPKTAMDLLGYSDAACTPIPAAWSSLLPTGPRLSTGAAVQVQGS